MVKLHPQAQRFFAYFSNYNNRRMTFVHAAIILSFMQRVEEYLVAFKDFDYTCSLGYKWSITSKGKWRHVD